MIHSVRSQKCSWNTFCSGQMRRNDLLWSLFSAATLFHNFPSTAIAFMCALCCNEKQHPYEINSQSVWENKADAPTPSATRFSTFVYLHKAQGWIFCVFVHPSSVHLDGQVGSHKNSVIWKGRCVQAPGWRCDGELIYFFSIYLPDLGQAAEQIHPRGPETRS